MNEIVFLSHSNKDNETAELLFKELERRNIHCWYDRYNLDGNIEEGNNWKAAIVKAIKNASIFVLIFSNNSNSSKDVEIELEHAGSEFTKNGMVILPFRLTKDQVNEGLDYYLHGRNWFDGSEPPIESKINIFCDMIQRTVNDMVKEDSPAADKIRLKKLEDTIGQDEYDEIRKYIETVGLPQITNSLKKARKESEIHYKIVNDPYEEYKFFNEYQIDNYRLPDVCKTLIYNEKYSIALGQLYSHVAFFLINGGKLGHVQDARNYLEQAIDIFNYLYNTTPDLATAIVQEIIKSRWLLSITHKQERNFGLSIDIIKPLIEYAERQYSELNLQYSKSVLLPRRELAIITKDKKAFIDLISDKRLYEDDQVETFHTFRRAFEFYCEQGEEELATEMLPKVQKAFDDCSDDVYGVYGFALKLNMFQYYCQFGSKQKAEEIYIQLKQVFSEKHFERYLDRIEKIHDQMQNNRRSLMDVR